MSAIMKATGAGVALASTGTWISLDGWPAVVAFGAALSTGATLVVFVLASDARTRRVLSVIAAIRYQHR